MRIIFCKHRVIHSIILCNTLKYSKLIFNRGVKLIECHYCLSNSINDKMSFHSYASWNVYFTNIYKKIYHFEDGLFDIDFQSDDTCFSKWIRAGWVFYLYISSLISEIKIPIFSSYFFDSIRLFKILEKFQFSVVFRKRISSRWWIFLEYIISLKFSSFSIMNTHSIKTPKNLKSSISKKKFNLILWITTRFWI